MWDSKNKLRLAAILLNRGTITFVTLDLEGSKSKATERICFEKHCPSKMVLTSSSALNSPSWTQDNYILPRLFLAWMRKWSEECGWMGSRSKYPKELICAGRGGAVMLASSVSGAFNSFFICKILFIYSREWSRVRKNTSKGRSRGKGVSRKPDAGLHTGTPGPWPEPNTCLTDWDTQMPRACNFWS